MYTGEFILKIGAEDRINGLELPVYLGSLKLKAQ
jgi:hypothetical protein